VAPAAVVSFRERPDLRDEIERFAEAAWPVFLRHANTPHWSSLFTTFADYQLLLLDADNTPAAIAHTIPLLWDGTVAGLPPRFDDVTLAAMDCFERGVSPNTLSALAAIVGPERRSEGWSEHVLRAMAELARARGLGALIAPVRPTWKSRYPLTPFARYVQWTGDDGAPFDPWLRVHWRLGARVLGVASRSMVVDGRVKDWEAWTGMRFPASGDYVVPGALTTVRIDRARDRGRYVEPNVWMLHPVGPVGTR